MATLVTATLNNTYDTINVRWQDNASNETRYQIMRQDNLSNTVTYDVNKLDGSGGYITYKDGAITTCRSYTYFIKVFNDCVLSGTISVGAQTSGPAGNLVPPPNLASTFDLTTKKLTASKGYFTNRVELSWRNNNAQHIEQFKIYRKVNGTSSDSTLVGVTNAGAGFFLDNSADARVYYKYTIVGVKNCNDTEVVSNTSEDIGFRNPVGNVSGHIEYNGGVALRGAKVILQQAGGATGSSVSLQGATTDAIPTKLTMTPTVLGLTNQLRVEFWFKPTTAGVQNVVEKAGSFSFKRRVSDYEAIVVTGGTPRSLLIPASNLPVSQWNHVSMLYAGDNGTFKVFVNGTPVANMNSTGAVADPNNQIVIGGGNVNFLMDEFRVMKTAAPDSVIQIDHARFLNGSAPGMVISLRFDENFGQYAYDASSQSSVYNAHHFQLSGNVVWSLDKPSSGQLSYYGITDDLGNYSVSGITFSGTGENFTIVPSYLTHSFTPNSRQVYLGDASTVFSNQDFTDNSSFTVSGDLFYGEVTDANHNGTIEQNEIFSFCPTPDAVLKIDGNAVIAYGQQVKTDANGRFTIEVPIGNHFIEIERTGHDMAIRRFPATGVYNFQRDEPGLHFIDSTKRSIVGRVVGGQLEAAKVPGLGRSRNNIGRARIRLASPIAGVACYSPEVMTDAATGEYRFEVYPLQYRIESVALLNDPYLLNTTNTSNTNILLDLRNVVTATVARDTVRNTNGDVLRVDTATYHKRHDMIYRVVPTVEILANTATVENAGKFIGETSLEQGATISLTPDATHPWGALGYPVFQQGQTYAAKINAKEVYHNIDTNTDDHVPLSGKAQITNEMVDGADPNATIDITNGVGIYQFICGVPNTSVDTNTPGNSGTKTLQIDVTPKGGQTIHWEPNGLGNGPIYRSYVLGSRIVGAGVLTQGPEKVDYILRDPPGSGSFATWGAGSSVKTSRYTSFDHGGGGHLKEMVMVGAQAVLGIGVGVVTDNFVGLGLKLDYDVVEGSNSTFSTTETNLTTISTRGDAGNVVSSADLFIGKSTNLIEGLTLSVDLVDASDCATLGGCFGSAVQGKRLAVVPGVALGHTGISTRFVYTQTEIETVVIPKLEFKRNTFLNGSNPNYVSHVNVSDRKFGSNNDDPLWGSNRSTTTPTVADPEDYNGSSYTFTATTNQSADSVRILNNQIALWKRALARNEREKIASIKRETGYSLLDNFTLGTAIVTNSYSREGGSQYRESWEHSFSQALVNELQVLIGNNGVRGENSITFNETWYTEDMNESTNTDTFTYTLTDGDPGDIMSIDVYGTSTGNVFVTRGGQTMCPYEGGVESHYFDPANPDAFIGSHTYNANGFGDPIQVATQQREDPKILVTPVNQVGIPSNQSAVFQLNLSNAAITNYPNDVQMRVFVASQSNPDGAVVKIDGLDPNTLYTIPKGASLTKTLTIDRGPVEINYDSIMIVFASACSDVIADTVYVSAHFIPTCTPLKLTAPNDNWVFNNGVNNSASIVVSDYNYNYGAATDNSTTPATKLGFNKIGLEFKPANTSTWTEYSAFYKYPTVDQLAIPTGQVYAQYPWDISGVPDGAYELRAVSYCLNKDGSYSTVTSPVHKGVMDRINPVPFGTPSPADGILDPQDDISIKFNESIDIGALSNRNFDVRGVLNGGNSRQSESVNFDGMDDYAEVSAGASLQQRSFTFEFWAMINGTGIDQTVISQGTDVAQRVAIGFDATNRFTFSIGSRSVASVNAITTPGQWHHYAAVYDYALQTASLYVDGVMVNSGNTSIFSDYNGQGKLVFGKLIPGNTNYFNGNLNDMRLWSKTRTQADIALNFNKALYNNSSGLLYNWKMNESNGTSTHDVIRSRDAMLYGASWRVTPNGYAAQFDGVDDRLDVNSTTISITREMDFTLEFWFKSSQPGTATLFSNGKGDGLGAEADYAWNVQKDVAGIIHVYHNGYDFVATDKNFFDGEWHHFALVMQRTTNLSCYVDGELQKSVQALSYRQMGGANMYIGARGYLNGTIATYDNYFNGSIDEFRFWNIARKAEQIKRDKQNRMIGDEYGLLAFVPFESYATDPTGIALLAPTFKDYSADITSVDTDGVLVRNGVATTSQTPVIKLPRPVGAIDFVTSVNNDEIVITPTTAPALLENVTIDITVKDVYDLRGNMMSSPKTWIAYVNKNQVLWQDIERSFTKKQDEVVKFTASIVNNGGALKAYSIGGLPSWLSASTTSGTLSPSSVQPLTFTMAAGTPVGDYDADITLDTDFGYSEVLRIHLKVIGDEPVWVVNPANFRYSMSVVGEIKIDGVIATNTATRIAAFTNDVLCGVAYLTYMPAYDRYEAFLNVYSNEISGDSITFKVYDATTGMTFVNVTPKVMFTQNDIVGTVITPQTFVANSEVSLNIPLKAGWTWISLPLASRQLQHSNLLMADVKNAENDIVRTIDAYDQYAPGRGWTGEISSSPERFTNGRMYQIKRNSIDTLSFTGVRIHPEDAAAAIDVVPGWNWIGYVATKNADVNTAMSGYTATTGDILKSQYEFSVYDSQTGWVGSLSTLRPGLGYMLKSATRETFNYPASVFYGKAATGGRTASGVEEYTDVDEKINVGAYEKTMSVIAQSNLCEELKSWNIALAAFDAQNTLRGYATPIHSDIAKDDLYYLTIYGNQPGETLKLKYIDLDNGTAIPAQVDIKFSPDVLLGLLDRPLQINVAPGVSCVADGTIVESLDDLQVFPNPFSRVLNVTFNYRVNVTVELVDMLGRVHAAGTYEDQSSVSMDLGKLNLPDGVYMLRVSGDVSVVTKVIKNGN